MREARAQTALLALLLSVPGGVGAERVEPAGGAAGGKAPVGTPGMLDVRDFGAKGDGLADDTKAIQDAIAALPRQGSPQTFGGGTVLIPAGTYRVSGGLSLPDNVHVVGVGNAASQIQWVGGSGAAVTLGLRCSVRDLWIRGNPTAQAPKSIGINVRPSSGANVTAHWLLARVRIVGFDVGIDLDRTWSASIQDSLVMNNASAGIRFGSKDVNAIVVRGGELQGNRGAGAIVGRVNSVVFDGVVIEHNGLGIEIAGDAVGLVVRDCYFEVNELGHIAQVGGVPRMAQIVGSFFANASKKKAPQSIHVVGGTDWVVEGNAFLEENTKSALRFEKAVDRVFIGRNYYLPGRAFRADVDFMGTNLSQDEGSAKSRPGPRGTRDADTECRRGAPGSELQP